MIFTHLQTGGIGSKNSDDLIADFSENRKDVVFRALQLSLIGISANRDDCVDRRIEKLAQMLGTMFRNINPNLVHDLNRKRVNMSGGCRTRTFDSNNFAAVSAKDSLSHLTSTRITGTQN